MGDEADATLECFGRRLRARTLDELLAEHCYELEEHDEYVFVAFEALAYGGHHEFCDALRRVGVPFVFFHAGDHEHAPWTLLSAPEPGEWSGPADAEGRPVVLAEDIDHEIEDLLPTDDDAVLIEALHALSGVALRKYFAGRRAALLPERARATVKEA